MRAVLGLLGLVLALAVVGWLSTRQLSALHAPLPSAQTASGSAEAQSRAVQQQVQQQLEALMQQPRRMPDDE